MAGPRGAPGDAGGGGGGSGRAVQQRGAGVGEHRRGLGRVARLGPAAHFRGTGDGSWPVLLGATSAGRTTRAWMSVTPTQAARRPLCALCVCVEGDPPTHIPCHAGVQPARIIRVVRRCRWQGGPCCVLSWIAKDIRRSARPCGKQRYGQGVYARHCHGLDIRKAAVPSLCQQPRSCHTTKARHPRRGTPCQLPPPPPTAPSHTSTQWSPPSSTRPRLPGPNHSPPRPLRHCSLTYAMCVWAEYSSSGSADSPVDCHNSSVDTSGGAVSDSDTRVWRERLNVARGGSS